LHAGPRGTPRITRGWDGWLDLSHGGLSPPILCQLAWRTLVRVIRYRSLLAENRSMSAMPRKRRVGRQSVARRDGPISDMGICHSRACGLRSLVQRWRVNWGKHDAG